MWGRYCEILIGIWLVASSWILAGSRAAAVANLICGIATVLLAASSFTSSWRRAHLAILVLAGWLVGQGWLATRGVDVHPPAAQNQILVGLLLATFAIVPSQAARPPDAWRARAEHSRR